MQIRWNTMLVFMRVRAPFAGFGCGTDAADDSGNTDPTSESGEEVLEEEKKERLKRTMSR